MNFAANFIKNDIEFDNVLSKSVSREIVKRFPLFKGKKKQVGNHI
jgi:hypothetical protein